MLQFICIFLNFFLHCYVVFLVQSFMSLVNFVPKYFIFPVDLENMIFFLISVSNISLLVHENAFNCWMFNLCNAILTNSCIRSSSFLVESIGFSVFTTLSSSNSDSFNSSFQIWMPFISFSCLITVPRTFNTRLNRSVESGHPCLMPDFRGKAVSFCPFGIMLAVGFWYMAFIMLM